MQMKELDGVQVIDLGARVDVSSSPVLEKMCNGLLEAGHNKILCDFSRTEYVSSIGLRVFLSTLKRTGKSGGRLVLCGMKPGIVEIFDMTGLTGLFQIFETVEAALTVFRAEAARTHAVKDVKKPGELEEIIIDKPPKEATLAYQAAQKQGRMDEKI